MKSGFGRMNGLFHGNRFVAPQVVHNDDIAGTQNADQLLLDIGKEAFAVDGTIEDHRCGKLIASQSRNKSHRAPVTVRRIAPQSQAFWTPTTQRCHVCLDPGLVKKHKAGWIKAALYGFPALPPPRHISASLFKGEQRFF